MTCPACDGFDAVCARCRAPYTLRTPRRSTPQRGNGSVAGHASVGRSRDGERDTMKQLDFGVLLAIITEVEAMATPGRAGAWGW